jgi:hypothetical protein
MVFEHGVMNRRDGQNCSTQSAGVLWRPVAGPPDAGGRSLVRMANGRNRARAVASVPPPVPSLKAVNDSHTESESGTDPGTDMEMEMNNGLPEPELAERRFPVRDRRMESDPNQAYLQAVGDRLGDPLTYRKAMSQRDADLWQQAALEEFAALRSMGVCELCDLPPGKRALPSKGVLVKKRDDKGNVSKYKYRCVVVGSQQVTERDFRELFAPTAQSASFCMLIATAAAEGKVLRSADVCTAYLNAPLVDEDIYVRLPPDARMQTKVWRLQKALYGLKQAARAWYGRLHEASLMKVSGHQHRLLLVHQGHGEGKDVHAHPRR